ncbi:MAG: RICIN domain-containing protein [Halioglobus sp.]
MKLKFILAGLLVACVSVANSVELNKDALKSMQQEGHKLLEESSAARAYKGAGGFCLDIAGEEMVVRSCNAKTKNQQWKLDGQARLVAQNGKCIDGARLKKCSSAQTQKWSHDGKKRLANGKKQCLQIQGEKPKAGAKVVVSACSGSTKQVWK